MSHSINVVRPTGLRCNLNHLDEFRRDCNVKAYAIKKIVPERMDKELKYSA